jgi:hypothetical protein
MVAGTAASAGLGLIVAAGLFGAGLTAYKFGKRYVRGKALGDPDSSIYRNLKAAGIHIPSDEDVRLTDRSGWKSWAPFRWFAQNTTRLKLVMGNVAQQLYDQTVARARPTQNGSVEQRQYDFRLEILSNLGLRVGGGKPDAAQIARALKG